MMDDETPAKTILIVDNDINTRKLLRQQLEAEGYTVQEAPDGTTAIAQVRENQPALIVLDIMMPDINGLDVAAILKNDPLTAAVPIVLHSVLEEQERAYRIGVDKYLVKPLDSEILLHEVATLLKQGSSKKRVLVIDADAPAMQTLSEAMLARGYKPTPEDPKALGTIHPNLIIAEMSPNPIPDTVPVRFSNGSENVLFVQLSQEEANGCHQSEETH